METIDRRSERNYPSQDILGIHFFDGDVDQAIDLISSRKGFMVAPSGTCFTRLSRDAAYREAMIQADLAIPDSGAVVLLWSFFRHRKLRRISGLKYLRRLTERLVTENRGNILWVLPNETAQEKTKQWLRVNRLPFADIDLYVAPRYDPIIEDRPLLAKIESQKPDHVIVGIGSGPQEKLGHYLRCHLSHLPAIHCIGAALGFLTGDQIAIPEWADRFYLGWLLRLMGQPRIFAPRMARALELPWLIWKYGETLPPLRDVPDPNRTANPVEEQITQVLGIRFFCGSAADAVEHMMQAGGYMVVPPSPALMKLRYDADYRKAMQKADLALADSALLTVLWRIIAGTRLQKISGVAYLKSLIENVQFRNSGKALWIVASDEAKTRAIEFLRARGIESGPGNFQVSTRGGGGPQDHEMLLEIEKHRPTHIVIALGAGIQEKLGLYFREYLLYRPNIHCLGAALGFLTGDEPPIPDWAERWRLGWLFRLVAQPGMFLPRIGIAFVLGGMLVRYRSELPPLKTRWSDR